jgi:hypothetical protein
MSDLPYRYPISISCIDIGSYIVTLRAWCPTEQARVGAPRQDVPNRGEENEGDSVQRANQRHQVRPLQLHQGREHVERPQPAEGVQ